MSYAVFIRDFRQVFKSSSPVPVIALEECRAVAVDKYQAVSKMDKKIVNDISGGCRLEIRMPVPVGEARTRKLAEELAAAQGDKEPVVVRVGSAEHMQLTEEARRLLRGT